MAGEGNVFQRHWGKIVVTGLLGFLGFDNIPPQYLPDFLAPTEQTTDSTVVVGGKEDTVTTSIPEPDGTLERDIAIFESQLEVGDGQSGDTKGNTITASEDCRPPGCRVWISIWDYKDGDDETKYGDCIPYENPELIPKLRASLETLKNGRVSRNSGFLNKTYENGPGGKRHRLDDQGVSGGCRPKVGH